MTVLILADHNNEVIEETTLAVVTAAGQLDGDVHILVAGSGCAGAAQSASSIAGVSKVITVDHPNLEHLLPEAVTPVLVKLMDDYDVLMSSVATRGKSILPRVAAALDVMQISDILSVESQDSFTRPIYAGNAIATIRSKDRKKVITVRGTAFAKAAAQGGSASVEAAEMDVLENVNSSFISEDLTVSERPDLTAAKVIVSGGRALGSAEDFTKVIEPLADKLGAAIGASRAAVDAGYISNDYQVGQTGKIVAPELYIACGISGAIQHLAGMKDSKVIVAINKDEDAPIFQIADVGLVADLFKAVPEMTNKL